MIRPTGAVLLLMLTLALAGTLAACRPASDEGPAREGQEGQGASPAGQEGHTGHGAAPATPAGPAAHGAHPASPAADVVSLDTQGATLANVATAKVGRRHLAPRIAAAGRVTYDESRLTRVTAWIDGRIQRLYVATTGATIRRGEPIADIYGPDLVATQQELLVALESARALAGSPVEGVAADSRRLVDAARRRLRLWGLSGAQIAGIERRGRPLDAVPILAPASGVVIRRLVQTGDWVAKGTPLFEIADLSRVWIEADVYEYELAGLRPGLAVEVAATAYPGETFRGRVAFVVPALAAETRTNAVRVELANPGLRLKPDMLVTATIALDRGTAIVVPADAVLDTGKRRIVWVQQGPGRFAPRDVVVGARSDEGYEIKRGLAEGETIAISGGFMLDAASQLGSGMGAHAGHGAPPPRGPASPAASGGSPGMPGMPGMSGTEGGRP